MTDTLNNRAGNGSRDKMSAEDLAETTAPTVNGTEKKEFPTFETLLIEFFPILAEKPGDERRKVVERGRHWFSRFAPKSEDDTPTDFLDALCHDFPYLKIVDMNCESLARQLYYQYQLDLQRAAAASKEGQILAHRKRVGTEALGATRTGT